MRYTGDRFNITGVEDCKATGASVGITKPDDITVLEGMTGKTPCVAFGKTVHVTAELLKASAEPTKNNDRKISINAKQTAGVGVQRVLVAREPPKETNN